MSKDFENTTNFIYQLTSKRLQLKKEKLGLKSNYQVAGFKNQIEYNEAPNYNKVDVSIISKILNDKRENGKNLYLIPSKNADLYYQAFLNNLNFSTIHEILWGNNKEIQDYLPQLFQNIILDSLKSQNKRIRNVCSDLMNCRPEIELSKKISMLYEEIKEDFSKEFIDFTRAIFSEKYLKNPNGMIYEIVDTKGTRSVLDVQKASDIGGTKLNDYLGYQKLNQAFEKFVEIRLIPFFVSNLIEQFDC
ncbi:MULTISPECIES: hypothetical protein [unclassified Enterococcus]|uniref:hypothetical protein n=1 Tax=unclassified Enterococcus TaxID=2608891 RepID=UPI001554F926|nr:MULTISPECIES: hypothetical protein [unclassified Enterococcus]MBS7576098.1 hypothetical protein [Enterococcus sp. MMGLQ5-2]MBS7583331.1 hypothetical protein [Enterococcus sp. MMGLQ5-1]NPD11191.1 hypothetical protein [Enterococcus sp. MMGLQ5-1]NPD35934.1 hypothetical protein [Enterococcus sp. MMGLQ5-2]